MVKAVSPGISAVGKLTTQTPVWLAKAFREIPPNVTTTLAPGSDCPVIVTFTAFSAALMTLSVATEAMVRSWLSVSMVTARRAGSLILPEESVAITVTFVVPSAGICAPVNDALHLPSAAALIVRLIAPQVSSIDTFGSAVPRKVTPFSFSAALMMLSVATGRITGLAGGCASTFTVRVATGLSLPTASDCVTFNAYSPSSGICELRRLMLQLPNASAVAVRTKVPNVRRTLANASALPRSWTPPNFSVGPMRSSPVTALMVGRPGATVSICIERVTVPLELPNESFATTETVELPSTGISEAKNAVVHVPVLETSAFLVTLPNVKNTVLPASPVPAKATPAVFSAPLIALSPDTAFNDGVVGGAIFSVTRREAVADAGPGNAACA